MAAPADGSTLPDAGTKLRMVLDYVPCEACLAHPVADQDLLCGICARLDRQVAVRVGTRTTVVLERPSAPAAPIVIPPASEPAAPAAPSPTAPKPVVVRFPDDPLAPAGSIDVVVEAMAPVATPALALAPVAPPPPAPEPEPEEPVFHDDIVSFTAARDEFFDYRKPAQAPAPSPAPEAEPVVAAPEDDFVFRPPDREEPAPPVAPEPEPEVEEVPVEEIPVEPEREAQQEWAPPPDFLAEEEPAPQPVDEQPLEAEVVEMEPVEEEVLEMEVFEEEPEPALSAVVAPPEEPAVFETEEVVEMEEVVEEAPARPSPPPSLSHTPSPSPTGDLYRLRGVDKNAANALYAAGFHEVAQLSGRDAAELAERADLPLARVQAWIQVADLAQEVGVPIDAASALVAAGVAGPKGLAEADADEIADRVAAFGGATIAARDIKRWKRRA